MRLGILTASISRQAGGLFWSVRFLSKGIRDVGCNLMVFAGEDKYSSTDRSEWGEIPLTVFSQRGPAAFGYQVGLSAALKDTDLDLAHVHGLWMHPSVASKKWGRNGKPYFISPRGMLDPWAVSNSAWKKRLAGLLYENRHLRGAACIHALCDSEYASIRAYGLKNPVAVIPNGVDLPDLEVSSVAPEWSAALPVDSKVLFFLSRLHPKKGLVNLLHAWSQIKSQTLPAAEPWHLVIAGWEQGGHQAELERLTADLGSEASVHFVGPQFDIAKAGSFRRADAFILPSFSEGLPMAVLEAWSYGLPVIMTPQCNIPEGFDAGAAFEVHPEVSSIRQGLADFFNMTDAERLAMGQRGRGLVEDKFTWQRVAEEMVSVYQWVLGGGQTPSCVTLD
jgi:poly(glycerol-phosphate) alpha-glucosyltransferase